MTAGPCLHLLVVEDHPAFRLGLVAMINAAPDMKVIAEASDAQEGLALFRRHKPDVVLMDLRLPGTSGVEAIIALRREFPNARVIVITTYDADEDIYRALQSGAKSYLLKEVTREELTQTIRAVHNGKAPLPPSVAERLAARMARPELTTRERDMLRLLTRGYSNKEIAAEFKITEDTVKGHLKNLFVKLGVNDRTQAAICAVQHGIVHL
jgi:two-component system NarL family response regulator